MIESENKWFKAHLKAAESDNILNYGMFWSFCALEARSKQRLFVNELNFEIQDLVDSQRFWKALWLKILNFRII